MTIALITAAAIGLWAIAASVYEWRLDGYHHEPTARIRREPGESRWR